MFLKSILFTSLILLSYQVSSGQSGFPYEAEWKQIDSLMNEKNLPKSALVEVNKVYAAAEKEKNEAQWVKSIIYKNHLRESGDRNSTLIISELEREINGAPPRVAALLKSMEAEQLYQYRLEHLYQMGNRTNIRADSSADIAGWSISRFNQKTRSLYLSSLDPVTLLQRTSLDSYDPVLVKGNARDLRPTLFDLLSWRALDYFRIDDPGQEAASDEQLMENPVLFSEAPYFMHFGFMVKDTNSNRLSALRIYQQLLRFHAKDVPLDAWIDADISRIHFFYQYAGMPGKDSMYMNALGRITSQFPTLSVVSQAWYLQAQWWADQAAAYHPAGDTLHRFDFLKAVSFCEQAIQQPDSSEGKSLCEKLLREIHRSVYNLKIEEVNLPDLPFRVLVTYKNIHQLYGRIIRIDDATKESFDKNSYDLEFWKKWIRLPFYKSFQQAIPETGDCQQHRVEIKMDALPAGQYALLISSDSAFSNTAVIGLTTFFCSSIAFVQNGRDYFVLNRDSGHPLQGVQIKTFIPKFSNGGHSYVQGKTYQTDVHGFFRLSADKENSNQKLEFYYGKDYLSNSRFMNFYRYGSDEASDKRKLSDNLFTDRSIYRPGQIVQFKGILLTRDKKTGRFEVSPNQQTSIFLKDVNDQKIDSLSVRSNDFGSIRGSFLLPQFLLNGEFKLYDGQSEDEQRFSVEEYKRPSFFVDYDSVKGTCRIGDTIILTGSAMAFAGNSIEGAKLSWRVYRESRFPYPWLFRYYPPRSDAEIAHGEYVTDANGKFNIQFNALPDQSINKLNKPVYFYRVEATVTDASGESKSAVTSIAATDQSFEIVSSLLPESRVPRDSLYQIPVTTKNASGIFIKEKLTVSVYPLEGPSRLIRKRYWEQPDQFVISGQDFLKAFPNDEYRDETDLRSWKQGVKVYNKTDSTSGDGLFLIDKNILTSVKPGWYLFEFRANDKDGEEIIDKRFVEVYTGAEKSGVIAYNLVRQEDISAEPGSQVTIHMGTEAKDLFVIRSKQGITDRATAYSFFSLNQQIKSSPIEVRESDRGGFAIYDVFVKNNRWYISEHNIRVPWTNKELKISYQTWNDKTRPGNKEEWKIRVSGYKKDQVMAEVLTSMYDASLDQFKAHSWSLPNIYTFYKRQNPWADLDNFGVNHSNMRWIPESLKYTGRQNIYDELIDFNSGNWVGPGNYRKSVSSKYIQNRYAAPGAVMDVELRPPANEEQNNEPGMEMQDSENFQNTDYDKSHTKPPPKTDYAGIQIRKNFSETAFFQPDLKTDAKGDVEISFTMPEALTQWKWMILAHSKDLSFGYSERKVVTQKEFMLQTNMPRFFREGDTMMLPVKITNLSSQAMTGTVQLEWLDVNNNQPVDQVVGNRKSSQPFRVNASKSSVVFFPASIPAHFTQTLLYRITAKTDLNDTGYSDGEEAVVPVLSNRMLVTESLPLNLGEKGEQHFVFEKLLKSNEGSSLQNQSLTVEYTTNPAWYAVQSLPYLMEFPYECAEQTFNRFYANALASHIIRISPAMQAVFEKWKNEDTAALLSNLQKNEELKSILLNETPWVLEAQNEKAQKKNLALLFDLLKMHEALKSSLNKLEQMQSDGGGFPWFKGGRDDRYITQYIIAGIGRLRKLKAIPGDLQVPLDKMVKAGIACMDNEINRDFEKREKAPDAQNIGPIQVQYLYMRSFFPDMYIPGNIFNAFNYYRKQSIEKWMKQSVYMQGMIALYLNRTGDKKTAGDILASLKENAAISYEQGMYWKSVTYGYFWQEAPVETQSVLIEAFQDLHAEKKDIDRMKYWLLQQKRTQHWPTTKATADACYALLLEGSDWLSTDQTAEIQLGTYKINADRTEAGTGYFRQQISGNQVKPDMGNIQVITEQPSDSTTYSQRPTANGQRRAGRPSWGAIYWQYFEDLDRISSAGTSLSLSRNLFIERNSNQGPVLESVSASNVLKPGDKLKMRIVIKTDRDLEYVHLKDMRAACLEPVNVLSRYQWQGGLGYYETTQDASTSFFFDRLPKGDYVFEYPVYVTSSGNYSNGISSVECMYAPEFTAHCEGVRIQVESK